MPFTGQYLKLFDKTDSISKTGVRPRNFYKINSYTYADGTKKALTGAKAALVFVFGKDTQTLYALKVNKIKPEKFFGWLRLLKTKRKINWENENELEDLVILSDKTGRKIFQYIKGKPIYTGPFDTYRTYTIKNIGNIEKVSFNKGLLQEYLS
jgi:hypothetical protein